MRVILGIGNPGIRYQNNRHNVGFMFLDYLANALSLNFVPAKSNYYYALAKVSGHQFVLVKPNSFVNNSGLAAAECLLTFNAKIEDLLVVYDDLNLEPSRIRIKSFGGGSGHNGVSSIIYHLNSDKFPRLRIGIGKNFAAGKMADYVLSDLPENEKTQFVESFQGGKILVEEFIKGGLQSMLDCNSKIINSYKSQSLNDIAPNEFSNKI